MISFRQFIIHETWSDTAWKDGDISITLDDVLKRSSSPVEINPLKLKHLLIPTDRDPSRVDAADLQYPIVVSTLNNKYNKILDGNHRLAKAIRDKSPVLVRILDLDNSPDDYKFMFS